MSASSASCSSFTGPSTTAPHPCPPKAGPLEGVELAAGFEENASAGEGGGGGNPSWEIRQRISWPPILLAALTGPSATAPGGRGGGEKRGGAEVASWGRENKGGVIWPIFFSFQLSVFLPRPSLTPTWHSSSLGPWATVNGLYVQSICIIN